MTETVLFHKTTIAGARAVAKGGFVDEKWSFGMQDNRTGEPVKLIGVLLTDRPLGRDEGPQSADATLEVHMAMEEQTLLPFEIEGVTEGTRLFVIPANLVNEHARVRILEVDPRTSWWYEAKEVDEEEDAGEPEW